MLLSFIVGVIVGFGANLSICYSIFKIGKAYHNLFIDYYKLIKKYKNDTGKTHIN